MATRRAETHDALSYGEKNARARSSYGRVRRRTFSRTTARRTLDGESGIAGMMVLRCTW